MSKEHRICVDRREFPREPSKEPVPDDTLFIYVTAVLIAISVTVWAGWLVWVFLT